MLDGKSQLTKQPSSASCHASCAGRGTGIDSAGGWEVDLAAHLRRGGSVVGLCGGFVDDESER